MSQGWVGTETETVSSLKGQLFGRSLCSPSSHLQKSVCPDTLLCILPDLLVYMKIRGDGIVIFLPRSYI